MFENCSVLWTCLVMYAITLMIAVFTTFYFLLFRQERCFTVFVYGLRLTQQVAL